jgi:ABC-2 type transport system ATP-binding protein
MTPLVRTRQLVRRFGRTMALDGIDLDVAAGESVALLGHNGSGRTALLHILAALRPPTSGTVEIAGVDAARFPFEARLHATYVGAGVPAAAGLRVRECLELVRLSRRGRGARWPGATIDVALDRSALPADAAIDELSTGLRRRLALAAALVAPPRVLLLDDPFASLDADARRRFLGWLMEVRTAGATIVAAVNDAAEGATLCDTILRMERGRIVSRETSRATAFGSRAITLGELGVA